jgi:hypothetical protein
MPADVKKSLLLPSQRKDVFDALNNHGLDPSQFAIEERHLDAVPMGAAQGIVSAIVHRASDFYFVFDLRQSSLFFTEFSPGSDGPHGFESASTYSEIHRIFRNWIGFLRREISTPDVWAAVTQAGSFATNVAEESNEPFVDAERVLIAEKLKLIGQYAVTSLKVQGEQAQFVHAQLDYLRESSERLGRKDWLNTFAGVILSIGISTALPPEQVRGFFQLAVHEISQVVTGLLHGIQGLLG